MKTCGSCEQQKPLGEFYANRSSPDGRHSRCKACHNARSRAWIARNGDRHRSYQREHKRKQYAAAPEVFRRRVSEWQLANESTRKVVDAGKRARRRAAPAVRFTANQLAAKRAYWGNRCWMCGGPDEAIDHVKPLAAGGPHMLANLRPACRSCNSRKNRRWPIPLEGLSVSVKLTAPHPVHGEPGTVVTGEPGTMLEHELVVAGYAVPSDAAGRRKPEPKADDDKPSGA